MLGVYLEVINDLKAKSHALLAVQESRSPFYFPYGPPMPDPNVAYDRIVVLGANRFPSPSAIELASFTFGKPGATP